MLDHRQCVNCNSDLYEDPQLERLPCPNCQSLGRRQFAECEDTVVAFDGYRLVHKRPGIKRPLSESRRELSYFVKDNEWHIREMLVDRENNHYHERITRFSTGELVHEQSHPLKDHTGHGDDKTNPRAP